MSGPSEKVGSAYAEIGFTVNEAGLNSAKSKLGSTIDSLENRAKSAGSTIASALGTAVMAGGVAAAGAATAGLMSYKDLEGAASSAAAKSVDVNGKSTEQIKAQYDALQKHVIDVSRQLGQATVFDPTDVASAYDALAGAGQNVANIGQKELLPFLNLASTDMEFGLGRTTELTMGIMNSWGMSMEDSGQIADMLSKGVNGTSASLTDYAYALKQSGSVAAANKMPLQEYLAVIGDLKDHYIQGEMAGEALKTGMLALATPTKTQSDALAALGLTFDQVNPATHDFMDIMGTLKSHNATIADFSKVFTDSSGSILYYASQDTEKIKGLTGAINDSKGTAQTFADLVMGSDKLTGAFEQAKGSAADLFIAIGQYLEPYAVKALNVFTALVPTLEAFGDAVSKGDWGTVGSMLQEGFKGALSTLECLGKTAWEGIVSAASSINWKAVGDALYSGVVWGMDQLKQAGSTILSYLEGVNWGQVGTAILGGIKTFVSGVASLGSSVLNALMGINWSGVGTAILSGVKSVLSGAVSLGSSILSSLMSVNWSGVGTSILDGIKSIGSAYVAYWTWLYDQAANIDWSGVGTKIWDGISAIKDKAVEIGTWIWDSLNAVQWDNLGNTIGSTLHTTIEAGIALLSDTGDKIKGFIQDSDFSSTGASIGEQIKSGLSTVSGWMDQVKAGFLIGWGDTGKQIGDAIKSGLEQIKDYYSGIKSSISDWITSGGAKSIGESLGNTVANAIKDAAVSIINFGQWIVDSLKAKGNGDMIKGAFQEIADWGTIGGKAVTDFITGFVSGLTPLSQALENAILGAVSSAFRQVPYGAGNVFADALDKVVSENKPNWGGASSSTKTAAELAAEWEQTHSGSGSSLGSGSSYSGSGSSATSGDLIKTVEKIVDGKLISTVTLALDGAEFPLKSNGNLSITGDIYNPMIATSSGNVSPEDFMRKAAAQGMTVTAAYNLLENSIRSQQAHVDTWNMSGESYAKNLGVAYEEGRKEWEAAHAAAKESTDASNALTNAAEAQTTAANAETVANQAGAVVTGDLFSRLSNFNSQFSGTSTAAVNGLHSVAAESTAAAITTRTSSEAAATALTLGGDAVKIGLTSTGQEIAVIGQVAQENFTKAGEQWVDDSASAGTQFKTDGTTVGVQFKKDGTAVGTQLKLDGATAGQNLAAAIDPSGPNFYDWVDRAGQALLGVADSVLSAMSTYGSSVAGQLAKATAEANQQLAQNQSIQTYSAAALGYSTAALGLANAVISNANVAYLNGSQSINANNVQNASPSSSSSNGGSTVVNRITASGNGYTSGETGDLITMGVPMNNAGTTVTGNSIDAVMDNTEAEKENSGWLAGLCAVGPGGLTVGLQEDLANAGIWKPNESQTSQEISAALTPGLSAYKNTLSDMTATDNQFAVSCLNNTELIDGVGDEIANAGISIGKGIDVLNDGIYQTQDAWDVFPTTIGTKTDELNQKLTTLSVNTDKMTTSVIKCTSCIDSENNMYTANESGSIGPKTNATVMNTVGLATEPAWFTAALNGPIQTLDSSVGRFTEAVDVLNDGIYQTQSGWDKFPQILSSGATKAANIGISGAKSEAVVSSNTNTKIESSNLANAGAVFGINLDSARLSSDISLEGAHTTVALQNNGAVVSNQITALGAENNVAEFGSGVIVGTNYLGDGMKTGTDYLGSGLVGLGNALGGGSASYIPGSGGYGGTSPSVEGTMAVPTATVSGASINSTVNAAGSSIGSFYGSTGWIDQGTLNPTTGGTAVTGNPAPTWMNSAVSTISGGASSLQFAEGGYVSSFIPHASLAEEGPEYVIPARGVPVLRQSKPTVINFSIPSEITRALSSDSGNGAGREMTIILEADGLKMARTIMKIAAGEKKRVKIGL